MSNPLASRYTLNNLIRDMRELRRASGRPSFRTIARESLRVADAYSKDGFKDTAPLSATALNNVLNEQRRNPPRWSWLIIYVMTCREIASNSPGLGDSMSDEEALILWRKRLDAVQAADEPPPSGPSGGISGTPRDPSSGPPQAPSDLPAQGQQVQKRMSDWPGPAGGGLLGPKRSSPPSSAHDISSISRLPPPREPTTLPLEMPTLTQQRLAATYGSHGLELLAAAEPLREPDASYRIGLLLILDGHRHEGLAWLMQAENDGRHPLATGIIELDTPAAAIEQAFELGEFAAAGHDLTAAAIYYQRAALHGHFGAIYRLAELYELLGDHATAERWHAWAMAMKRNGAIHDSGYLRTHSAPSEVGHTIIGKPIDDPRSTPPEGLPVLG